MRNIRPLRYSRDSEYFLQILKRLDLYMRGNDRIRLSNLIELVRPSSILSRPLVRNLFSEAATESNVQSEQETPEGNIIVYEFYFKNGREEDNLIGVLQERRKDRSRITHESIMKWGKLAAGSHVDPNTIYYIKRNLQKNGSSIT